MSLKIQQFIQRSSTVNNKYSLSFSCFCRCPSVQYSNAVQLPSPYPTDTKDKFAEYFYRPPDQLAGIVRDKPDLVNHIIKEMDVHRFKCLEIPKSLSPRHWKDILDAENEDARKHLYKKFYKSEKVAELKKKMKIANKTMYANHKEMVKVEPKMFLKRDYFTRKIENLKVVKTQLFGPHVIIDCSYENYMKVFEISLCANQIVRLQKKNRKLSNPFNIIHCNVHKNGPLMQMINKRIPNIFEPNGVFNYTEKSFIDLFPHDQLVYLSPHADVEIEIYDPNKVYIIGGFVDLCPKDYISTTKAETCKVQTMKLPLDKYLHWCKGTKSLCLDEVVSLLNYKMCGIDWEKALKTIKATKTTFSAVDTKYCFLTETDSCTTDILRTSTMSAPFYQIVKKEHDDSCSMSMKCDSVPED